MPQFIADHAIVFDKQYSHIGASYGLVHQAKCIGSIVEVAVVPKGSLTVAAIEDRLVADNINVEATKNSNLRFITFSSQ
jgi:hypothetical protein